MEINRASHRDLCSVVLQWLLSQRSLDLGCIELKHSGGFVDTVALSTKKARVPYKICVAEVKRTRPDLLQDLQAKKMLKYERASTHCYLAATPEALGNQSDKDVIQDLTRRGLPPHWGLLVIHGSTCRSIRPAQRHRTLHYPSVVSLTRKIARSLMYRSFRSSHDLAPLEGGESSV